MEVLPVYIVRLKSYLFTLEFIILFVSELLFKVNLVSAWILNDIECAIRFLLSQFLHLLWLLQEVNLLIWIEMLGNSE